jgi:hypothetical protein
MKKVALIGDCHTARIAEHYDPKNCPINLTFWGKGGTWAWWADPENLNVIKSFSTKTENAPLFGKSEDYSISFDTIKNQDLVFIWLGYIDIRQGLPGHKNADKCAKQYVERFTKYFKDSRIRFIEPLPQLIPLLIKAPGIHPEYTFEERMEQNKIFIESLNKYSNEYGLETPITQQQIFNALGFGQNEMTEDKTDQPGPHPFDKLNHENMKKIYNLIIKEASKE